MEGEIHVLSDETPQHLGNASDHLIEIQDFRLQYLLAAEGKELPGKLGASFAGPLHLFELGAQGVGRLEPLEGQRRVTDDDRQRLLKSCETPPARPPMASIF